MKNEELAEKRRVYAKNLLNGFDIENYTVADNYMNVFSKEDGTLYHFKYLTGEIYKDGYAEAYKERGIYQLLFKCLLSIEQKALIATLEAKIGIYANKPLEEPVDNPNGHTEYSDDEYQHFNNLGYLIDSSSLHKLGLTEEQSSKIYFLWDIGDKEFAKRILMEFLKEKPVN